MAKRIVFIFEDLDDAGSEEPHANGDHGGARVGKLSLLSEDPVRGEEEEEEEEEAEEAEEVAQLGGISHTGP